MFSLQSLPFEAGCAWLEDGRTFAATSFPPPRLFRRKVHLYDGESHDVAVHFT